MSFVTPMLEPLPPRKCEQYCDDKCKSFERQSGDLFSNNPNSKSSEESQDNVGVGKKSVHLSLLRKVSVGGGTQSLGKPLSC